jgi:hypothetical protein
LLICFKEANDEFGPIVQKEIDKLHKNYKNIRIVCSTSGKMNN